MSEEVGRAAMSTSSLSKRLEAPLEGVLGLVRAS